MLYRRIQLFIRDILLRERAKRELDEEMEAHLALAEHERLDSGENAQDARWNARLEFGNKLLIRQTTQDEWAGAFLEKLLQDLRYIFLQMKRNHMFTTAAVLTLALGLGSTTAMFSIVNGVLLRPLSFPDPDRLFVARTLPPRQSKLTGEFPVNARVFHEWRMRCRACAQIALVRYDESTLTGKGPPVKLPTYTVSFNFFQTLGVQPKLGRSFFQNEELPGQFGEVILTDALWRSHFDSDPNVIGRKVQLNGETWTIIGVMPADLHLPKGGEWGGFFGPDEAPLIFRPLGLDVSRAQAAGNLNYLGLVRLKARVTREQAMAELNSLHGEVLHTKRIENSVTLIPLEHQMLRRVRAPLWLLLGAVCAVLLIACVNVGNLMLVRAASHQREAGVRIALGATRGQLFAVVLEESLVLVAVGAGIGLMLAEAAIHWFGAQTPIQLPRMNEIQIDWRVLTFVSIVIAGSTLLCGLLPAWRLARTDPFQWIQAGRSSMSDSNPRIRSGDLLVGLEVATSTVLLIAGGLLLLSFFRLMEVETGIQPGHIITQDLSFLSPKYRDDARSRFVEELVRKLGQAPGVESAAAVNQLPLIGEDWVNDLKNPDQAPRSVREAALANFRFVSPAYFQTMGIPLKQGRRFEESDRNRPKAVISEKAARYLWLNDNPLGKHVMGAGPHHPSLEIVGVVGEVRAGGLEQPTSTMMVYEHFARVNPVGMSIVARTQGDPLRTAKEVREIVAAADPEMALPEPKSMEQILDESVAPRKLETNLAVAFAATALVLAVLGLYGVVSFSASRRTQEIGLRMALGAGRILVMKMVIGRGMLPVLAGIAAGLIGALSLGRFLSTQLFATIPYDPAIMVAVTGILLVAAAGACCLPAWRAARIDCMKALRFD